MTSTTCTPHYAKPDLGQVPVLSHEQQLDVVTQLMAYPPRKLLFDIVRFSLASLFLYLSRCVSDIFVHRSSTKQPTPRSFPSSSPSNPGSRRVSLFPLFLQTTRLLPPLSVKEEAPLRSNLIR
jgi:hypothetical protein